MTRREAIRLAGAMGASLAWRPAQLVSIAQPTRERRDLFPQGVASGDPTPESVILWTRRPPSVDGAAQRLTLEVSETPDFRRVAARGEAVLSETSDWTCRVLAAGLEPDTVYWYRCTDNLGFSSRLGRTATAPAVDNRRPVRFVFVSCQNVQLGACNAYRRMISEDARVARSEQVEFVLHLGDFLYEVVWYPEDRPQGYYSRKIRDIVRYQGGEKHADFHVPTTLADYRALYRAYLQDSDLQDARARWPFVCMADNHEFSWKGWQSQEDYGQGTLPAQTRKVAANQAWFEYQPSSCVQSGNGGITSFDPPAVSDAPIGTFDDDGLGLEPGNLAAIGSLKRYRTMRWGKNVDLLLTDNRSYRSQPLGDRPETAPFRPSHFPAVVAQDVTEVLDAGRAYDNGHPPETIRFGGVDLPNPRKASPPQSMLGGPQKQWFLEQLRDSRAPWKLWGNSVAGLDWRIDFQNLPEGVGPRWPTAGYALFGDDDWSGYRHEREEILEFIEREGLTGVASLCGDRHAFLAGVFSPAANGASASAAVVEFVTGSISAPGIFEALEHNVAETDPLRPIFAYRNPANGTVEPAVNLAMTAGVGSCLGLARTHDLAQAAAAANPQVAPDIAFTDVAGHGYAVVRVDARTLRVEFVCIPRPIERSSGADGGPLVYRITHEVNLWSAAEGPRLTRSAHQGSLPLGAVNRSTRFGSEF